MISPVHLHLMLTHVPVIGTIFAVLLLGLGVIRCSADLQKAGLTAIIVSAVLTVPLFYTGEPAEDAVKRIPGVVEQAIDVHEHAATVAFVSVLITGALSILVLILGRRGRVPPRWITIFVLLCCLTTSALMIRTAGLGGKIHHPEIGSGALSNPEANPIRESD